MKGVIFRILSLVLTIFLLGWLIAPIHEAFHKLIANSIGVQGSISTTWMGSGFFTYAEGQIITPFQDAVIGLGGGILTGIAFLLIWFLTGHVDIRKNPSEANNTFPFLLFGIGQFIYSPFDAWLRDWIYWGDALGIGIGFIIPILLYGKTLLKYLEGDEL